MYAAAGEGRGFRRGPDHGEGGEGGNGRLPGALGANYPGAAKLWEWFWVFPGRAPTRDHRSGEMRRHHVLEDSLQRSVRKGAQAAGIAMPVWPHLLRQCFATHLLEAG